MSDREKQRSLGRRIRRILVRGLAAGLVLLAVLVLSGATWNAVCNTRDRRRFPPPGQLLAVDGLKQHLHCTGQGQPTVILDSGFSMPALSWALVQPELSKRVRVCSYDRVGLGYSDPDPSGAPQTSARIAERLHTLLVRAGVRGPLVLVGHSNGGYLVRSYYARFPGEVVGAVLIDSSHERMDEHFIGPSWESEHRVGQEKDRRWLLVWRFLSWSGVLRGGLSLAARSSKLPLPQDVVERAIFLFSQPAWRPSTVAEGDGIIETVAEMRTGRDLGSLPLIVLTAGRFQPRGVPDRGDHWNQLWVHELQPQLARLSTRGRQIIADSGHLIPFEAPGAAIQAVSEVLAMLPAAPVPPDSRN